MHRMQRPNVSLLILAQYLVLIAQFHASSRLARLTQSHLIELLLAITLFNHFLHDNLLLIRLFELSRNSRSHW